LKGQELGVSFAQDLIGAGAMSEAQAFLKKAGLKKDDKVKGLERQAASFSEAEQKSLAVKDKEARAAKNGENDYRVALTYFGMGKYTEAAEAARRAVQPDRIGRLKRPDEAQMLLGMALARGKKAAEAKAAFAEARKDAKMAPAADLWMAVAK
jgi:thioredoxin-like negative regulator of GroEL